MADIIKLQPHSRHTTPVPLWQRWTAEADRRLIAHAAWIFGGDVPDWVGDRWWSFLCGMRSKVGWDAEPDAIDWESAWVDFTECALAHNPEYRDALAARLAEVGA